MLSDLMSSALPCAVVYDARHVLINEAAPYQRRAIVR